MLQLGFVLPTGLMVLAAFLYLRRFEKSGPALAWGWGWGWISLYIAGIASAGHPGCVLLGTRALFELT